MVQCNNLVLSFKLEGTKQENLLYPVIHYNEDWISFIYNKLEEMGLYARNVLIVFCVWLWSLFHYSIAGCCVAELHEKFIKERVPVIIHINCICTYFLIELLYPLYISILCHHVL